MPHMLNDSHRTSARPENLLASGLRPTSASEPRLSPRVDVEHASDLRRRHARSMIERLVEMAGALPKSDRVLIETLYRDGRSASELAAIRGEDARAIRRRVRRLVRRVLSPEFRFVAMHKHEWPRTRRAVAEICVIEGRSLRDAAASLGTSLHAVRRHRDTIAALSDDAQHRERTKSDRDAAVGVRTAPGRSTWAR